MTFSQRLTLAPQELQSGRHAHAHARPPLSVLLVAMSLAWAVSAPPRSWGADTPDAGFLFDEFDLTLAPGQRTEALGPFYYSEQQETKRIWAVPPLLSYTRDPDTESQEFDFLYPVMTYDRHGDQYRWQFLQLLSLQRGPDPGRRPPGTGSPFSLCISSNALRTQTRITPRCFRSMATCNTTFSGTTSSSSCGRCTARRERRTW